VYLEATRLAEVFSDGDAAIEEVEVELVDISRSSPQMPSLGWMPPDRMSRMHNRALGTLRRRKET
jgi:hypothetical protein